MGEELALPTGGRIALPPFGIANGLFGDFNLLVSDPNAGIKKSSISLFCDPKEAISTLNAAQEVAFLYLAFWCWVFPKKRGGRKGEGKYRRPSDVYASYFANVPPLDAEEVLTLWEKQLKNQSMLAAIRRRLGMKEEETGLVFKRVWTWLMDATIEAQKQFSQLFISYEVEEKKKVDLKEDVTFFWKKYVPARVYTTENGLLPLAWAEVLHAVENDIYARPCAVCGDWFPLQKGQVGQEKYCKNRSPSCLTISKRLKVRIS